MKTPSEISKKFTNSVVMIDLMKPAENGAGQQVSIRGTGFIVDRKGTFVTAAHVFNEIPEAERKFLGVSVPISENNSKILNYQRFPVKMIGKDDENDYALFQIIADNKSFEDIELGDDEAVSIGEDIVMLGYPLATELLGMGFGITITMYKAIVSTVKRRSSDGSLHFFFIDAHINRGASGSPLFSLYTGKVVGMATGTIEHKVKIQGQENAAIPANLGICRPIQYVHKLISKNS